MIRGICVFSTPVHPQRLAELKDFLRARGFSEYQQPSPRVLIFTAHAKLNEAKFASIKSEVVKKFQVVVDRFVSGSTYIEPAPDKGEPISLL